MKKLISILLIMIAITALTWAAKPAAKDTKKGKDAATTTTTTAAGAAAATQVKETATSKGFAVNGDKVIFTFNPTDYTGVPAKIDQVVVAGDFNSFNGADAKWTTKKDAANNWVFESTKKDVKSGAKFRFVVNKTLHQKPDTTKVAKDSLADDGADRKSVV